MRRGDQRSFPFLSAARTGARVQRGGLFAASYGPKWQADNGRLHMESQRQRYVGAESGDETYEEMLMSATLHLKLLVLIHYTLRRLR